MWSSHTREGSLPGKTGSYQVPKELGDVDPPVNGACPILGLAVAAPRAQNNASTLVSADAGCCSSSCRGSRQRPAGASGSAARRSGVRRRTTS